MTVQGSRVVDSLGDKSDNDLLVIVRDDAADYLPEVVDGARSELRRRGVPLPEGNYVPSASPAEARPRLPIGMYIYCAFIVVNIAFTAVTDLKRSGNLSPSILGLLITGLQVAVILGVMMRRRWGWWLAHLHIAVVTSAVCPALARLPGSQFVTVLRVVVALAAAALVVVYFRRRRSCFR